MDTVTKSIARFLTFNPYRPVVLCIGTDLVIGDAFGPLVGELLRKKYDARCFVYGTLDAPVTALNLDRYIRLIRSSHKNSKIIAVDSALGKSEDIGKISYREGSIKPGLATGKKLSAVGDFSVVMTVGDITKPNALSSVRLGFIYRSADKVASALSLALSQVSSSSLQYYDITSL